MFQIPTTVEIADGRYPAVSEAVEAGTGSFGPQRKWSFLVEHDGKIDSISTITSANLGPRSKAYQFLTGILGKAPKAGDAIEEGQVIGVRVLVDIEHNEKGFPTIAAVHPYVAPQQELPGIPR